MRAAAAALCLLALALALALPLALALAQDQGSMSNARRDPPLIYSARPADPWNRIFALLFTRTVRTRYTDEFADRGPFEPQHDSLPTLPALQSLRVSTRTFDRYEQGDRAVDAFYPSFLFGLGPTAATTEPARSELLGALNGALEDRTARSPLARALMQADLWSAYDTHAAVFKPLLAKLIGRLALSPAEIAALPNDYENARQTERLPDVFGRDGPWVEMVWSDFRLHDESAGNRRAARVFLLPLAPPGNPLAFLKAAVVRMTNEGIAAVALATQMLLVDSSGRVVPTPIVTDVQIRTFRRDARGGLLSTAVSEYELSRRRLLADPSGDGFVRFDDGAPAYLPTSGNDYDFASPAFGWHGPTSSTVGTLRTRCGACHEPNGGGIFSFAAQRPERMPAPRVLPEPNDIRAACVASAKASSDEFKRLIALAGLR